MFIPLSPQEMTFEVLSEDDLTRRVGEARDRGQPIVLCIRQEEGVTIPLTGPLEIPEGADVTIRDGTIEGNGFVVAGRLTLQNVTIQDSKCHGLKIVGQGRAKYMEGCISECMDYAVHCEGNGDVQLEDVVVEGCKTTSVSVDGGRVHLSKCTVTSEIESDTELALVDCRGGTVKLEDTDLSGIGEWALIGASVGGGELIVTRCEITNFLFGLFVDSKSRLEATDVVITSCSAGICTDTSTAVGHNITLDYLQYGLLCSGSAALIDMSEVEISGCCVAGVHVQEGVAVLRSAHISDCEQGVHCEEAGKVLLVSPLLEDCVNGLLVEGDPSKSPVSQQAIVLGGSILRSKKSSVSCRKGGRVMLNHVRVWDGESHGLEIADGEACITGAHIRDCKSRGVFASGGSKLVLCGASIRNCGTGGVLYEKDCVIVQDELAKTRVEGCGGPLWQKRGGGMGDTLEAVTTQEGDSRLPPAADSIEVSNYFDIYFVLLIFLIYIDLYCVLHCSITLRIGSGKSFNRMARL